MGLIGVRLRLVTSLVAGMLAAQGCSSKKNDKAESVPASTPAADAGKADTADTAGTADKAGKPRASKFPPEARRNTPPEGIADTALDVGAVAPALEGLASTTGTWSRAERVTVVVFYRGDW